MVVGATVDNSDLKKLRDKLDKLSLKDQHKKLVGILTTSSLPIRKAAQSKAKSVVKPNSGFTFTRNGAQYHILPNTIEKSIGVIKLKTSTPMIDVGYRVGRKTKYDGWFAHFVDSGTAERTTKSRGGRGSIAANNIMEAGESGMAAAEMKIKKDVLRLIKRLSK